MLKTILLTALVATVYLLHQDFWNWNKVEPLVFGFLPIGLAYHVAYSLIAAITMLVFVFPEGRPKSRTICSNAIAAQGRKTGGSHLAA